MIKLYIYCLFLIIGSVEVGSVMDMRFHQEVMEMVSYDIHLSVSFIFYIQMYFAKGRPQWM